MSVRAKFRLSLAIYFLFGLLFLVCSVEVSEYFEIPLLLLFFGVGSYSLLLKCPNCGTRMWFQRCGSVPKNCMKCDAKLD